jgi:hypothetical protein
MKVCCLLIVGWLFAVSANASTATFQIAGEADATIITGLNTISVTLTDLYVNPAGVADNLSAFTFTLSTTPTSGFLSSSSGQEVTVNGPGYSTGSVVDAGWVFSLFGASTTLDVLSGTGHAGPAHTIIGAPGPNGYTNANGTIAGNGPHNPFLFETATFTLTEYGVTADTTVQAATFQFGTTDGSGQVLGTVTPEPATLSLIFFSALLACAWCCRRFFRADPQGN